MLYKSMNSGWLALDDVSLTPAATAVEVRKYNTTPAGSGARISELRYMPWDEPRYSSGNTPTAFQFTGQRDQGYGLIDFGARFYSPRLSRWIRHDSLVPDPSNPLDFDRFAYVRNNPIRYNDPSGHRVSCGDGETGARGRKTAETRYNSECQFNLACQNWSGKCPDYKSMTAFTAISLGVAAALKWSSSETTRAV